MENPHSAKTAEILSAAEAAFTEYGYRKVTMDDVAERAGITRTALYYYYKNKEELFLAMLDGELIRYRAAQQAALCAAESVNAKFSVFAREYSLLRQTFGSVFRITHADITGSPEVAKAMKTRLASIHSELLSSIILSGGKVSKKDAEKAGAVLALAVRGIVIFECENRQQEAVKNAVFLLENFYEGFCLRKEKE